MGCIANLLKSGRRVERLWRERRREVGWRSCGDEGRGAVVRTEETEELGTLGGRGESIRRRRWTLQTTRKRAALPYIGRTDSPTPIF
jgi:hypothetical protein